MTSIKECGREKHLTLQVIDYEMTVEFEYIWRIIATGRQKQFIGETTSEVRSGLQSAEDQP